jgi:hypothetical protein
MRCKCGDILSQTFGNSQGVGQLIYRLKTIYNRALFISADMNNNTHRVDQGMLLQVLPPVLITSCPGTSDLVGSSADCGCPSQLWCHYHRTQTDVLKIHYQGYTTTLVLSFPVSQATGFES